MDARSLPCRPLLYEKRSEESTLTMSNVLIPGSSHPLLAHTYMLSPCFINHKKTHNINPAAGTHTQFTRTLMRLVRAAGERGGVPLCQPLQNSFLARRGRRLGVDDGGDGGGE
jgi:hypothetical protein